MALDRGLSVHNYLAPSRVILYDLEDEPRLNEELQKAVQLLKLMTIVLPRFMPAHATARDGGKTCNWQQLWVITASSDSCNVYYNGYDLYTVSGRRALHNTHLCTASWESIKCHGLSRCFETDRIVRRRENVKIHTTTVLGNCRLVGRWNKRSLTPRKYHSNSFSLPTTVHHTSANAFKDIINLKPLCLGQQF